MEQWWNEISLLNKAFVLSAAAFSVLFVWQVIAMIVGLDGDHHMDTADAGTDFDHGGLDHGEHPGDHPSSEGAVFTFLSTRSIIAFGTLFSWAGTLYLASGASLLVTIIFSTIWGLVAMVGVSAIIYFLLRMQETGDPTVWSAVGQQGNVYMDIPEGGTGKVRVLVNGIIKFVNARSSSGQSIAAGTSIRVTGIIDDNTVEVAEIGEGRID